MPLSTGCPFFYSHGFVHPPCVRIEAEPARAGTTRGLWPIPEWYSSPTSAGPALWTQCNVGNTWTGRTLLQGSSSQRPAFRAARPSTGESDCLYYYEIMKCVGFKIVEASSGTPRDLPEPLAVLGGVLSGAPRSADGSRQLGLGERDRQHVI